MHVRRQRFLAALAADPGLARGCLLMLRDQQDQPGEQGADLALNVTQEDLADMLATLLPG